MARSNSFKLNVAANFGAQIYVLGIGFAMAPVYLQSLGIESYGLIGFFTTSTALFMLLDAGLTPTLARETARFRGGAICIDELRTFLRAIELVFAMVALVGTILMYFSAGGIATNWLSARDLSVEEITLSLRLMGLAMPLRWLSGLYRGVVNGFERQVWLGVYSIAIATFRFVGILVVFYAIGATVVNFFAYQVAIALLELTGLVVMTYRLLQRRSGVRTSFSWKPLIRNVTFSLTISFTATVWVVIMQADKFILSTILPLAAYGTFSIAAVAAGAINAINAPFNQAVLPRLTRLISEKNDVGATQLYCNTTQVVCVIMAPAATILCFFAEPVMRVWTGSSVVAQDSATILTLYAIGNGCVSLHSFVYYIQYAKGDIRLHLVGHAILLITVVPLFVLTALKFGAVGTGTVWALANAFYAFGWVPLVHARVLKGKHWLWMSRDVLPIIVPTILAGWLLREVVPMEYDRWITGIIILFIGGVLLAVAAIGSSMVRERLPG